jgi:hypothetical protein
MHVEDTQRLVTEIQMLKVVFFCIWSAEIIEVKLLKRGQQQSSGRRRRTESCVLFGVICSLMFGLLSYPRLTTATATTLTHTFFLLEAKSSVHHGKLDNVTIAATILEIT